MKKQTAIKNSLRKNTSIRLSVDDQLYLDRLRLFLSPHVRLSDNKVISAALKMVQKQLPNDGGK